MGFLALICFGWGLYLSKNYGGYIGRFVDALAQTIALAMRTDWLNQIMLGVTHLGSYGTPLVWLVIAGVLVAKREYVMLMVAFFQSVGGVAVAMLIKTLVGRLRPDDLALISEVSHSYPSLHAMTSLVVYMFLAYLIYYYTRKFWTSYFVFILGLIMAGAIGWSRVYLGVHYATDLIGGYSFGLGWFLGVIYIEKCIYLVAKKTETSQKIS